jgi:hypothetical protein
MLRFLSQPLANLSTSECDSPLRLIDLTFDYLEKNWADEIDFVICESPLLEGFLPQIT